jgi:uncharacterized protein
VAVSQHRKPSCEPLGETDDAMLNEIVRRLVETLQPERIYLFGSRARGETRRDSDYDLLVVVRERAGEGREMEQRAHGAMWGLRAPVDIVVMTATNLSQAFAVC